MFRDEFASAIWLLTIRAAGARIVGTMSIVGRRTRSDPVSIAVGILRSQDRPDAPSWLAVDVSLFRRCFRGAQPESLRLVPGLRHVRAPPWKPLVSDTRPRDRGRLRWNSPSPADAGLP